MSSTPRIDASRRNVTKSLTTLVASANVITHSREMLVLRSRLQSAPERHRRNHTMRRLILLAAGFGSVAALSDINAPGDMPDTFVGPLVDQNRRFVRYEIRFNRIAYEHAWRTKLYNRLYQPSPGQLPATFPPGSIIVKAAWRVIPKGAAGDEFKKTCYWVPARLTTNGQSSVEDVGLVGLHVI